MNQRLAHVTLLVRDYDEAIAFYTNVLGFSLAADLDLGEGKRWVVVAPLGPAGCGLLLAEATTEEEIRSVGRQGAGRVWLFLHTDDFWRDYPAAKHMATWPYLRTCTATSGTCWSRWDNYKSKPTS